MKEHRAGTWLWLPSVLIAFGCASVPRPAEAATERIPKFTQKWDDEKLEYDQLMNLPIETRNKVQRIERNLDRWLQEGSYGLAISGGKDILDNYVEKHAYAAYCVAQAYAAVSEGGKEKDIVDESLEYLHKAVEDGFLNVVALETTKEFDAIRKEPAFQEIVKELREHAAKVESERIPNLKAAIDEVFRRPGPAFELEAKDVQDKPIKAQDYAGKPILVCVLRPYHDTVRPYMPIVKEASAYAKAQGVVFLGAIYEYSLQASRIAEAKAFAKKFDIAFPCAIVDGAWVRSVEVGALPAFLLVDAKGRIRLGAGEPRPLDELKVFVDAIKSAE
ncbi:MAG: TlpA family protein disulfide reductase [Planctomycetes bacterium]|nr:TlpA family protein disulfide reductase [Planctomycetota bacterium]